MSKQDNKREQRQWWVSDDGIVKQVTGYSCAPANPEYWWCPAIGYSIPESKLYTDRAAAVQAAADECRKQIGVWEERLVALATEPTPVLDLDANDWETIKQAASESTWMPPEYMRNDWVSDVCKFLRGEQPTEPTTPCFVCKKPVTGHVDEYCCDGRDCGCMGKPIYPCLCSQECADKMSSGGTQAEPTPEPIQPRMTQDLGPLPPKSTVFALPDGWYLINPTAEETKIFDLLNAEIRRLSPSVAETVVSEPTQEQPAAQSDTEMLNYLELRPDRIGYEISNGKLTVFVRDQWRRDFPTFRDAIRAAMEATKQPAAERSVQP